MSRKLIKGVTVEMGGEAWVIPPLTLGQVEDLQDDIAKLSGGNPREQFAIMATVVHAAMVRNYPELTLECVRNELLDLANVFEVTDAVMGSSGLVKAALGEAVAGTVSTGASSTQA